MIFSKRNQDLTALSSSVWSATTIRVYMELVVCRQKAFLFVLVYECFQKQCILVFMSREEQLLRTRRTAGVYNLEQLVFLLAFSTQVDRYFDTRLIINISDKTEFLVLIFEYPISPRKFPKISVFFLNFQNEIMWDSFNELKES